MFPGFRRKENPRLAPIQSSLSQAEDAGTDCSGDSRSIGEGFGLMVNGDYSRDFTPNSVESNGQEHRK